MSESVVLNFKSSLYPSDVLKLLRTPCSEELIKICKAVTSDIETQN